MPFGDVNCFDLPAEVSDVAALFVSDAAPTVFMGADFCDITPGGPSQCSSWRRRVDGGRLRTAVVSVLGVYGLTDSFPMALITNKGLTQRSAQQHGRRYVPRLLQHVAARELDTAVLMTHELPLEDAVRGYQLFKEEQDGCLRGVFRP